MDPVFAVRSSFLSTHPQRRRKRTLLCLPSMWGVSWLSKFTFRMTKYSTRWVRIISALAGSGWSAISSALCLERWGCPSPITRLKTASWPWRRASWGCLSTPACWSLPSWSGGWGELLNLPLTQRTLQTPEVSVCSQVVTPLTSPWIPGSSSGDVHRWEDDWGLCPHCCANGSLRGVWRVRLSSIGHLDVRIGSSLYWIWTSVLRLFLI